MEKLEHLFERSLFSSRWLLIPFYVGLVLSIILLLIKFIEEFWHMASHVITVSAGELVIEVLHLIDLSLIASLLVIIVLSGYESFVSEIDLANNEDKPSWMGQLGFSELKIKLIGSIVAISAIDLLTVYLNMKDHTETELFWKVVMHLSFVLSGVLFAVMDKIAYSSKGK